LIKYSVTDRGISFSVKVQPRASRSEIIGEIDGALKLRLAAPPVDGEANAECVSFLSKHFGVRKDDVEIVSGLSSRNKVIRITGMTPEQFQRLMP